MRKLLALLATLSASACAQLLTLNCPITGVKAGTDLICTASFTNQTAAGLQFTVTAPSQLGPVTITAGASTIAAGKTVYQVGSSAIIGGYGPPPTSATLNANQFSDGIAAILTWHLPASLGPQNVQISLGGGQVPPIATLPSGMVVSVTPNPPQPVSILPSVNFCDINGDGLVNQADVTAQRNLVMTFPQPSNCARNASGCNVGAIQIVANAAVPNGSCTATQ